MSVLRQLNLLGQQRLDVPHLRALESSIAADFDVLAGRIVAGSRPLVVRGFTLTNYNAGTPAVNVQLSVADAILMNIGASEAGTFLWVPSNRAAETLDPSTNSRVSGGFTANQTNYIGLDLSRKADTDTSDLVQFLDANTLIEQPKTVPLARTLDYRIVISTVPFSAQPNIVPVAKIKTNASNQVASLSTDVEDARNMAFRLGAGGDFPNRSYAFGWSDGRVEFNTVTGTTVNQFRGGDKVIQSQKDWMDAIMTRIWEVGGGENWYSPTAGWNLVMTRSPSPTVFASTGDNFEFVSSHLHWQGLSIVFENSNGTGVFKNTIADQLTNSTGLTDITPGQCIYVDIDRTQSASVTAHKANLWQLGTPSIPGSRVIIAWCVATGVIMTRESPLPVNSVVLPATTTAIGGVRLSAPAGTPSTPTVIALDSALTLNVGTGVNGVPVGNVPSLVVTGNSGTNAAQTITPTTGGHGLEVFSTGSTNKSAIRARRTFTNTAAGHFGEDYDMALNNFYAPLMTVNTSSGNALGVIAENGSGVGANIRAHFPIIAEGRFSNTGYSEIKGYSPGVANTDGGIGLRVLGGITSSGNSSGGDALRVFGGFATGTGTPGKGIVVTAGSGGNGNQNAIEATQSGTGYALKATSKIEVAGGGVADLELRNLSTFTSLSSIKNLLISANVSSHLTTQVQSTSGIDTVIQLVGAGNGGVGGVQVVNLENGFFNDAFQVRNFNGSTYPVVASVSNNGGVLGNSFAAAGGGPYGACYQATPASGQQGMTVAANGAAGITITSASGQNGLRVVGTGQVGASISGVNTGVQISSTTGTGLSIIQSASAAAIDISSSASSQPGIAVQMTIGVAGSAALLQTLNGAPALSVAHNGVSPPRGTINWNAQVTPSAPLNGDMWYDGTNVKFRVGSTTKTFTLT